MRLLRFTWKRNQSETRIRRSSQSLESSILLGQRNTALNLCLLTAKTNNDVGYSKLNESTFINGSLSALGQWISALADPKRTHIPFRNSKLTKVLKDSLEINSKIALIVCISPSIDSYKETVSTLQFADRAKKAVLQAQTDTKKGTDFWYKIYTIFRKAKSILSK